MGGGQGSSGGFLMVKAPPWVGPSAKPVVQVEPTEEEARNGWTTETLSQYLHEREAAQGAALDFTTRRKGPPQSANSALANSRWMVRGARWTVGKRRWTVGQRRQR